MNLLQKTSPSDSTFSDPIESFLDYKLIPLKDFPVRVLDIIEVCVIIVATIVTLFLMKRFLKRRAAKKDIDRGRTYSIFKIFKYFLIVISVMLVMEALGIKVTILLAGSAALLVGLGMGIQEVFNNFTCGIILLFDRTIQINDIIEVDGIVGKVKEISMRTTKIVTVDYIDILIPNSKFVNDKVINWTHNNEATRFSVSVGVAYGSDTQLVEKILIEAASSHGKIEKSQKPIVQFKDFGDSSLNFDLYFWSFENFIIEKVKSDVRFKIDLLFRENNIEIPFPQRVVHSK